MDHPWVSHYDPGVPASLNYPDITLPELFARTVERFPQRVATLFHGRRLPYAALQAQIEAFAGGLRARGIRPGERVAIMLPNLPQFLVAYYGALRAGAVVVPTNPLYTPHELEHQLADAGAVAIITLDLFFARVAAALPGTNVRLAIVSSVGEALPAHLRPLAALKQRRAGIRPVRAGGVVLRFADLLRGPTMPPAPIRPEDLAVLQYTGGTTGRAKGAMLTHRNLIANAYQALAWQGGEPETQATCLCVAPFFHVYGMTIAMNLLVAAGGRMLLVPRWQVGDVAKLIRRHRPELFPGVPTMYLALAQLPRISGDDLSSLEICISGAAPLPDEVRRQFEAISGAHLVEGYGLTEASPVTHSNPVRGDRRPGTVGVPWPDTDAMITDPETWEPLPHGEVGEMTVRGLQVMQGYWRRPEETLAVLRDGWLHTGDLATCDTDGYFRIVDRKKDLIIAGGYNVYPREVEDVLYRHPKILEAAVIGVPNAYRGETVKAVVALRPGVTATAEEIIAYCRQELAPYKTPTFVEFRDDLPKSLIGKVLRRELRTAADTMLKESAG